MKIIISTRETGLIHTQSTPYIETLKCTGELSLLFLFHDFSLRAAWAGHRPIGWLKQVWGKNRGRETTNSARQYTSMSLYMVWVDSIFFFYLELISRKNYLLKLYFRHDMRDHATYHRIRRVFCNYIDHKRWTRCWNNLLVFPTIK